jgi:hypothetical protein
MDMKTLISSIQTTRGCVIYPSVGLPYTRGEHTLSSDLISFVALHCFWVRPTQNPLFHPVRWS